MAAEICTSDIIHGSMSKRDEYLLCLFLVKNRVLYLPVVYFEQNVPLDQPQFNNVHQKLDDKD